jgi:hypothetical protein
LLWNQIFEGMIVFPKSVMLCFIEIAVMCVLTYI